LYTSVANDDMNGGGSDGDGVGATCVRCRARTNNNIDTMSSEKRPALDADDDDDIFTQSARRAAATTAGAARAAAAPAAAAGVAAPAARAVAAPAAAAGVAAAPVAASSTQAVDIDDDDDDDGDDDAPAVVAPPAKKKRVSKPARTVGAALAAERERALAADAARVAASTRKVAALERARLEYARAAGELLAAHFDRRLLVAVLGAGVASGQARVPLLTIEVEYTSARLTVLGHAAAHWRHSAAADTSASALDAATYAYTTSGETREATDAALSALAPGVTFASDFVPRAFGGASTLAPTHGTWTCAAILPGGDDDEAEAAAV
jgi:hypothetical protein